MGTKFCTLVLLVFSLYLRLSNGEECTTTIDFTGCCVEKESIVCSGVKDPQEVVRAVETNQKRALLIEKSSLATLPYLTKDINDNNIEKIQIKDSSIYFMAAPVKEDSNSMLLHLFNVLERMNMIEIYGVSHLQSWQWDLLNPNQELNIIIKDSKFVEIPEKFSLVKRLRTLEITGSGVRWIHEKAFKQHTSLVLINLSDNDIEVIKEGTFTGAAKLKTLNLSKNKIAVLPQNFFHERLLQNCEKGDFIFTMDYNPLKELSEETFDEEICITDFSLRNTSVKCDNDRFDELSFVTFTDDSNCLNDDQKYVLINSL